MLKKIAILALFAGVLVAPGATRAADEGGCNGLTLHGGEGPDTVVVCQYKAVGAGTYTVVSVTDWTLTVKRGLTTVQTVKGGPTTPPVVRGALATRANDVVTLSTKLTCVQPGICNTSMGYALGRDLGVEDL
jgi:hypothetical protein